MNTVAVAIPHAPWAEGRKESLDAILADLDPVDNITDFRIFAEQAPNHVWSEHMWAWGASTTAEWLLQLQDDVKLADHFMPALRAMLDAVPSHVDVIGLEVPHQAAPALSEDGERWFTTTDMLIGVGYVIRTRALRAFLEWRASALREGALAAVTEDTLLALWCMVTGRRIWHPMPTLIDHDVTLASTYGNDSHENRRPLVRWNSKDWGARLDTPAFWAPVTTTPPHLGRFYNATPELAFQWVEGVTPALRACFIADDGAPAMTGLRYRNLARVYRPPSYRVFLCTPHKGQVTPEYAHSVWSLMRLIGMDVRNEIELVGVRQEAQDIVRVRSRMVSVGHQIGATHLLFADGDNAWEPNVVAAMLRTGKDFVQCPYLRRDGKGYTIRATEKDRTQGFTAQEDIQPDNTIEIEHTGLGLTLISRACIERMVHAYTGTGLDYLDEIDGRPTNVVALFQLLIRDGCLMGEDTSFAARWRDIGGKVWLYIGAGSPIAHYGSHCYQGNIEDLGFARGEAAA